MQVFRVSDPAQFLCQGFPHLLLLRRSSLPLREESIERLDAGQPVPLLHQVHPQSKPIQGQPILPEYASSRINFGAALCAVSFVPAAFIDVHLAQPRASTSTEFSSNARSRTYSTYGQEKVTPSVATKPRTSSRKSPSREPGRKSPSPQRSSQSKSRITGACITVTESMTRVLNNLFFCLRLSAC